MTRSGIAVSLVLYALAGSQVSAQDRDPPLAIRATDPALQWIACPPIFPPGCHLTVVHGDPGAANADVFLRVPGGYTFPTHRHSSAERMVLVTGQLRVRYQGAAEQTLLPGHYAYGPPGLPHRATCDGATACTLFIAFVGPVDAESVEISLD